MNRSSFRLVVLGDSIAYGTGARHVEDTLGPRLRSALGDAGIDVDLTVLAVPGAVSAELLQQVRRARPLGADLALVVIGANDLARFVPPAQAAGDLGAAVRELRAVGTDVLLVPAPDMSVVPFVPPAYRPAVRAASVHLERQQTAACEAAGGRVAPVGAEVGRLFETDPAMFAGDRFHPSSAGYAAIATALVPEVLAVARRRQVDAAAA